MMKSIKVVDFFCGVGGLSYGLRKSGLNVVAGFDLDESCKFAFERNNKGAEFIHEDIKNIKGKDLVKYYKDAKVKVLVGCAPCQTFSTHSTKIKKFKRLSNDHRWKLINEFARLVSEAKPDIVSMENVPLLAKQRIFKVFVRKLRDMEYEVSFSMVNCSEHGVPQNRRRLVLLASRLSKIEMIGNGKGGKTVREVIGSLPKLRAGGTNKKDPLHCASDLSELNLKRIRNSRPGGTWRDWPKGLRAPCHRKKTGSTYSSVYARMEWNKISPTITTQFHRYGTGRFGHPTQARALSLREGALLQSFPKSYKFIENKKKFSTVKLGIHIGNAVPPKLGEAIGKSITQHVKIYG